MVAFEIDDADRDGRWSWSVVAQGPAFDITAEPAAPGAKQRWLKMTATRVSGRRFARPPA